MISKISEKLLLLVISVLFFKYSNPNSEDLKKEQYYVIDVKNWSTCDEFLANTTLNISRVIDIDWRIFYYWSHVYEQSYNVKFSVPSTQVCGFFSSKYTISMIYFVSSSDFNVL